LLLNLLVKDQVREEKEVHPENYDEHFVHRFNLVVLLYQMWAIAEEIACANHIYHVSKHNLKAAMLFVEKY
jgi:hypothetical protein